MEEFRELRSRFKAKIKKRFESDKSPTRSSTPTQPNYPRAANSPPLEQSPSQPLANSSGPSVSISLLAPTDDQGEPIVPATEQVPSRLPSINAEALDSTLRSAPATHPAESPFPVVERTAALLPPKPIQAHTTNLSGSDSSN
ncbi:hypothetical protein RSAG8_13002, partial [Rhizoctonia solani AG-8 WAC10335]